MGFLSAIDLFVPFSLSGIPMSQLGVTKCNEHYKQHHLNIFFFLNQDSPKQRHEINIRTYMQKREAKSK